MSDYNKGGWRRLLSRLFSRSSAPPESDPRDANKRDPKLEKALDQVFIRAIGESVKLSENCLAVLDRRLKIELLDVIDKNSSSRFDENAIDRRYGVSFSWVLPQVIDSYKIMGELTSLFPALDKLMMGLLDRGYVGSAAAIAEKYGETLSVVMRPEIEDSNPGALRKYLLTAEQRFKEIDPPGSERLPESDRRKVINILYDNMQISYIESLPNLPPSEVHKMLEVWSTLASYVSRRLGVSDVPQPNGH